MTMSKQVAALDIGAARLMAGLLDESGTLLCTLTAQTPVDGGPQSVVDEALRLVRDLGGNPEALGATVPGPADARGGALCRPPAHSWLSPPVADQLAAATGLPVRIACDVHACALAEHRCGAGRDTDSLFWITVTNGIGAGLVIGGRVVEGARGLAGAIGHVVVEEGGAPCCCGQHGCLQAMVSGPAIARRAGMANAALVFEAARGGIPGARTVVAETALYLGRAVATVQNLVDPEMIVFGGVAGRALDLLLPGIERAMRQRAILPPGQAPVMRATALGYEAALIGAACLAIETIHGAP